MVYSCYDIPDKDTLGHLVIYKGKIIPTTYKAENEDPLMIMFN